MAKKQEITSNVTGLATKKLNFGIFGCIFGARQLGLVYGIGPAFKFILLYCFLR